MGGGDIEWGEVLGGGTMFTVRGGEGGDREVVRKEGDMEI